MENYTPKVHENGRYNESYIPTFESIRTQTLTEILEA